MKWTRLVATGSCSNWMNMFQFTFTRPLSPLSVDLWSRLTVLTTLITSSNFHLAFFNLISLSSHLDLIQFMPMSPPLTHPLGFVNVRVPLRSVARWETNGADLLPTVPYTDAPPEMSPLHWRSTRNVSTRNESDCVDVAVLARMQPSYDPVNELKMLIQLEEDFNRQLAASSCRPETEYGQIAPIKVSSPISSPEIVSPQESVLLRYYRHERPIAIVRPVLKYPIKSMDNSQGKCSRYRIKLRLNAHWSNEFMELSHVMNGQSRCRIAAAPNDNSNGKSSRFKGFAIVRVQTSILQFLEYAKAFIHSHLSLFVNQLRNDITMTPPMSSSIQVTCLLPVDPPHQNKSPYELNALYEFNSPLPPITIIKLSPNIILPPLPLSMLPPSNVTTPLPPFNDPLPLHTMLITFLPIPAPLSSSMFPLMSQLPHITRHRMSESIGLEAQQFPPPSNCAQSICWQWPSGATVACLSYGYRDVIE